MAAVHIRKIMKKVVRVAETFPACPNGQTRSITRETARAEAIERISCAWSNR